MIIPMLIPGNLYRIKKVDPAYRNYSRSKGSLKLYADTSLSFKVVAILPCDENEASLDSVVYLETMRVTYGASKEIWFKVLYKETVCYIFSANSNYTYEGLVAC